MLGYLFLSLAVVCFTVLGILHKVADFQKCRPSAINAYLFLWAWLLTSAYTFSFRSSLFIPRVAVAVAVACGLCASVAILAFQTGVRFGKISTSWLVINLSTAVPTVLSILFYHEQVGPRRGIALLAITLSLLFLWKDKQLGSSEKREAQSIQIPKG
jgi:drug/metabolite transporter (DMT)-like permease